MPSRYCAAVVAVLLGGAVGVAADPPRSTPDTVRATIKKLWSNDGDEAATAFTDLEGDPLALPVLRRAAATDPNASHRGVLERLIEKAVLGRDKVLAERVERWAQEGRLDLLTEVRSLTDGKAAEAALDHLLRAAESLREKGGDLVSTRFDKRRRFGPWKWVDGEEFRRSGPKPLFDTEVPLLETYWNQTQAIFADRITAPTREFQYSLVVCRSEFKYLPRTKPQFDDRLSTWNCCTLFANTIVGFEEAGNSVLVLDGDAELYPRARFSGTVLVVNGDVREVGELNKAGFTTCVVWATGDITLTPRTKPHLETVFFAGGKVADAEKVAAKGCAESGVTDFPVLFLNPAEYGLTLEATEGGVKVTRVREKSVFADAGVKAGDVIPRVGQVATATAPAFRRELRRGVIEGAVLLDVVRGKEKLELLVAVPDVPAAPPKKDNGLKATPPKSGDKK
jgi:PDZ domain